MGDVRIGPAVRTKPRDPDEARALREGGTPERLIGSLVGRISVEDVSGTLRRRDRRS